MDVFTLVYLGLLFVRSCVSDILLSSFSSPAHYRHIRSPLFTAAVVYLYNQVLNTYDSQCIGLSLKKKHAHMYFAQLFEQKNFKI